MDQGSSGISVIEIPPGGQIIPVRRESVAAFIGPAPRGPVDIPVAVRSLEEFLARFSVPGYLSRMELLLYQYFENGGELALVVRVCRTPRRNRIVLPGVAGDLVLEARHPGPLEHLRASVDHDGVAALNRDLFNLVIHRCRSVAQPLVEEQEVYQGLSVVPGTPEYVGDALGSSALVRLAAAVPAERPTRTLGAGLAVNYVYSRCDWQGDNAPTDYDLIGSREEGTGLFALEQVPWIDFIALVPGISGAALGPVALFAADRYARERHALLVLDPPESWTEVADVVRTQRQRGFSSPNAITYFPSLDSPPHGGPGGHLSAAGAIAGALAAAGLDLRGTRTLTLGRSRPATALDDADAHQLGRLGINVLARQGGRVELAGLVTMARSAGCSSWNSLRSRRVALFILSSVQRYTRWAAYAPPDDLLWSDVREQVLRFLSSLHRDGLLAGASAREAYYVRCDRETNQAPAGSPIRLAFVFGAALTRPGEFIAFRVEHAADGSAVREVSWEPGLALAG